MRKRIKWQTPELVLCGGIVNRGTLPYMHDGEVQYVPYQADWMTNPKIELKHEILWEVDWQAALREHFGSRLKPMSNKE